MDHITFIKHAGNTKGFAFVTALVLMVMFLSLGMGYLSMARTELKISRNQIDALKTFYASESALHHSLAEIRSNIDVNGDGLGNIPGTDLDGDGKTDYSAVYSSGTGMITTTGQNTTQGYTRQINTKITPKLWTGAFMVKTNINPVVNCDFSTIAGNVDAKGTITPNFYTQLAVTGTVTAGSPVNIPVTNTSSTGPWKTYAGSNQHINCSWVTASGGTASINGIHYVNGNCSITLSSADSLIIAGTLIVNGNLSISTLKNLTISPYGLPGSRDPALVVSGTLGIASVGGRVNITGLIYAGGDISLATWNFYPSPNHYINGAIVTNGNLSMQTVARTTWIFDTTLNPSYFSGANNGIKINYWKGN